MDLISTYLNQDKDGHNDSGISVSYNEKYTDYPDGGSYTDYSDNSYGDFSHNDTWN